MSDTPTDRQHFERMYARDPDPWGFASSAYERDKYAATVAALPERRFRRGLEVGCSIGVLSRCLAERCDRFLGLDIVESAVSEARSRCQDRPGASFERAAIPDEWPTGRFDLIVFSEVLYYLGRAGLARTAALTTSSLEPGGMVVLVNWLGETGAGSTGNEAAAAFIEAAALRVHATLSTEQYRVDVLASSPSHDEAAASGAIASQ